jgi:hypothetical protein
MARYGERIGVLLAGLIEQTSPARAKSMSAESRAAELHQPAIA